MCIICVEYIKGRLTPNEVRRAAQELVYYGKDEEQHHAAEILATVTNDELDKIIDEFENE